MTKLFLYIGCLWLAWAFMSAVPGGGTSSQDLEYVISMADLAAGDAQRYEIGGRNVIAVHRSDTMLDCLQKNTAFLYDTSPHPPGDPAKAKLIVMFAHEPELGCPVEFVPVQRLRESKFSLPPGAVWCGGFRDVCRGSLFDLAGRVYRNQDGQRNLVMAPYQKQGNSVLIRLN